MSLNVPQVDQVLALRGMLAHDLFFHGLTKRHLVEYGINRYEGLCGWMDGRGRGGQTAKGTKTRVGRCVEQSPELTP